jgi:hypothetical protein
MSTLPLVKSILRRGEDWRDVKIGMTSFKNYKSFWRGRGRGRGRGRSRGLSFFMIMQRMDISRAQAEGRGRWLQRLFVGNVVLCRGWDRQQWRVQLGQN